MKNEIKNINKSETWDIKFIKIFDHIIWYVISIVIILAIAYSNAKSNKTIYLTGTLTCSDLGKD